MNPLKFRKTEMLPAFPAFPVFLGKNKGTFFEKSCSVRTAHSLKHLLCHCPHPPPTPPMIYVDQSWTMYAKIDCNKKVGKP